MRSALLLLFTAYTLAAETMALSLKQAVEIALAPDGSPRAQLSQEAIRQAEAVAGQSRAALLPDLEGAIRYQQQTTNLSTFGLNFGTAAGFPFALPTVVGPFDVFDTRASVTQSVFDFSAVRRYQASKTGISAAKFDNESTRNQVADQVARAYLLGLRAEAALDTAKANVELSEALLKLASSQKEAGTGTGIEVTRAQSQLANDRQRQVIADNDRRRALLQLLKTMGVRLEVQVQLTDKLAYVPVDKLEMTQALNLARDNRPELKTQDKREENARLNYSAVKWERLPSVGAFADYGPSGTAIDNSIPTHTVGVSLRLPIFDGGRRDARRAESLSLYRQSRIRGRDLRDQVDLEVRLALDSIVSAEAEIAAAREGLTLAENELAQARRRYQAGVANSLEVTDAQTRLDRARDNQINALYNYNLGRIDLATSVGNIQTALTEGH